MSTNAGHNTWLDGGFWGPFLRRRFIPEIEWFERVVRERVLPVFNNIEMEADAASEEAWQGYMEQPSDGTEDPGDFADAAMDAGLEHYTRLKNVRQALVNMSVVSLWHLVEQQILDFHKRQVLSMFEENEAKHHKWQVFVERMNGAGIAIEDLPSWSKVNEMRVVANAIKHGEGSALNMLVKIYPDILIAPELRNEPRLFANAEPRVDRPAGGEDIYVTEEDIEQYGRASVQFWNEVASEVERVSGY